MAVQNAKRIYLHGKVTCEMAVWQCVMTTLCSAVSLNPCTASKLPAAGSTIGQGRVHLAPLKAAVRSSNSRQKVDKKGMLPGTANDTLLAKQQEFTDRVATLKYSSDLAEFIEDVDLWLRSPSVCNRVSPKKIDGAWRLILNDTPFVMTEGERISLAYGIRAFTFR